MSALGDITVLELGGIGPAPFAGMLLADMGARVVRIDRIGTQYLDVMSRGKRSIMVDVRQPEGLDVVRRLVGAADALIEGFRPGVLEKMGLAPEQCWEINPRVVIGRMTGWGQDGPLAPRAGHDINYIALAGALHAFGGDPNRPPAFPLNLVGDYGGGGLLLAFGLLCAIHESAASGAGQVVDAAMVDGAALLMTKWYGEFGRGRWKDERGSNFVDGASHFYRVYETADGRHVAVGALEPQFYAALVEGLGLDLEALPPQLDPASWPVLAEQFAAIFRTRTRDEWTAIFEGRDACVTPILSLAEAPQHDHNRSRGMLVEHSGVVQPAPAPRLSRTPGTLRPNASPGEHTDVVLRELGFPEDAIAKLRANGVAA